MKILWFSWKDINHPYAGGAENVSYHIMRSLLNDGHQVKLITSSYPGASEYEDLDNLKIIHIGNKWNVYFKAYKIFKNKYLNWPDLVIDEMNTIPFGCAFYAKCPTVLVTYQLARKVWFYQLPIPLSVIGYLLEPLYLYIFSKKYKLVLTESLSTRDDLGRYGFNINNIKIFRVPIDITPVKKLSKSKNIHSVLILGSIRPMKRTLDAIKAFEYARDYNKLLSLTIVGNIEGKYSKIVIHHINNSRHKAAINLKGSVSLSGKIKYMGIAGIILVTSVKEGWGLIVTEANSQGTPAIVYNVDGLRDSVNSKTGILVEDGNYKEMGENIIQLINNQDKYYEIRNSAWDFSKQFTPDNTYKDFLSAITSSGLL